jgi:Neuraminidase (sialidase)
VAEIGGFSSRITEGSVSQARSTCARPKSARVAVHTQALALVRFSSQKILQNFSGSLTSNL